MAQDLEISVPPYFQGRNRYQAEAMVHKPSHWSRLFRIYKFTFDLSLSLMALPLIAGISVILLLVNPRLNPGPLMFVQERLGRHRVPFLVYKFRTMSVVASGGGRSADGALEEDRITPLGRIMRRTRLDELPNFLNVLRGDMSVIGPRPDAASHAREFLLTIPHYEYRYLVKPGITGLAQIESGYAEGTEATALKAHYDQLYVETSCGRLDVYIAWRTIRVMLTGFGAR